MKGHWRGPWLWAPFALILFMTVSWTAAAGPPTHTIGIISLGMGFVVGWSLRIPRRGLAVLAVFYGALGLPVGLITDRWLPVTIATAACAVIALVMLSLVGQALGLHEMRSPADALRLFALAAITAVVVPVLTMASVWAIGLSESMAVITPQSAMTGVVGLIVAAPLVLGYERGSLRLAKPRSTGDLVGLVGAVT